MHGMGVKVRRRPVQGWEDVAFGDGVKVGPQAALPAAAKISFGPMPAEEVTTPGGLKVPGPRGRNTALLPNPQQTAQGGAAGSKFRELQRRMLS